MNLIRSASRLSAVYPRSREFATTWLAAQRFNSYRTYTSKTTENNDKNVTNPVNDKAATRSVASASPEKSPNSMEHFDALELRMKKQIDSAIAENTLKLKDLESRIKEVESRLNITRETRQIVGIEQRFWISIWILLLVFIVYKL